MNESLKPREIEVLRLMAERYRNREIAERLHLSTETVRWYAKEIYSKLGVSNRRDAASKARQLGLLAASHSTIGFSQENLYSLPKKLTPFVGRVSQLKDVKRLLRKSRLLTLTGVGGVGKTRLSIHTATNMKDDFIDGIFFVDLTAINNYRNVINSIAQTIGVIEDSEEALTKTLIRSIGIRKILLLLDNFEHVIDAAPLVSELLKGTEHLRILVTSREPLHLSMEQEYIVPPLSNNPPPNHGLPESVDLFMQRVLMVRQNFQLDETNKVTITRICERIDGLPLAIELAAVRCKLLTPKTLYDRLNDRLSILSGHNRDMPQRHQTLRATIDWSYELLLPDEQKLFARLAVFQGGWSLDAIEIICSKDLVMDTIDAVASLVDKSMIQQHEDELGEPRFTLLETLQEYALYQLRSQNEYDIIKHRYAEYYLQLTEQAAPQLRLSEQKWWFKKLELEQSNIRSLLEWALSGGDVEIGLRIIAALRDYWWYQGLHREGWEWIEQALPFVNTVSAETRADFLLASAYIAFHRRKVDKCFHYAQQALAIYQSLGDEKGVAWSFVIRDRSQNESITVMLKTLQLMRRIDDFTGQVLLLNSLGLKCLSLRDYIQAQAYFKESIAVAKVAGDKRSEIMAIGNL